MNNCDRSIPASTTSLLIHEISVPILHLQAGYIFLDWDIFEHSKSICVRICSRIAWHVFGSSLQRVHSKGGYLYGRKKHGGFWNLSEPNCIGNGYSGIKERWLLQRGYFGSVPGKRG